jgi:hypothetical protein
MGDGFGLNMFNVVNGLAAGSIGDGEPLRQAEGDAGGQCNETRNETQRNETSAGSNSNET